MRRFLACMLALGCGSSSAPATVPEPATVPAPAPAPHATAVSVDAAPPDAGIPEALAAAPAWIFRYRAADRVETWTLRHHGGDGLVIVERAAGTTRYLGTATEGAALAVRVAAGADRLALDCKRARPRIGTRCGDPRAPQLDVLDCYHPDFAAPMTFAPAPGVEFDATCNGYRRIPPE